MKYNLLGDTGLLVSELCFGTMTFGGEGMWEAIGQQEQGEADALVQKSVDSGINFIDTANIYSFGQSETILGNSIKNLELNRDELVIATKLRGKMGEQPNNQGLSRYHIFNSVEKSLKRLQLDHIDLLYVHGVDPVTPVREIMRGLNDIVESGKVRYIGVCNWPAWMVMKALGIARQEGWHEFKAMQYFYSLSSRDVEDSLIPLSQSEQLGFMPWSPLAGGFLSGKYTRDNEKAGDGSRRDEFDFPPIDKEQAYDIVDVMEEIADNHDASVAEVALAWVRLQSGVTSTIIGAKNMDQLSSNIRSVELDLSDDELKELDEVSSTTKRYPFWMVDRQGSNRIPNANE
ncbi:aldo/keto reductase [Rhodohalobacter sulfatireducens]|uniref:Aldo/keto reductase n=1 Tax=Rhodohalobacter sulfatireducens TaxID=2911366 RepID=A0ABS9KG73_9BACT|nr:aldo/keto reductase [Rhodohalobacter sulfatireducens]MCG2589842.1 aldo/keto reductase [Rhodohalobacter sulfatireducens]